MRLQGKEGEGGRRGEGEEMEGRGRGDGREGEGKEEREMTVAKMQYDRRGEQRRVKIRM